MTGETYSALIKLKKNSLPALTTAGIISTDNVIPVDHCEYFSDDDGNLITEGIRLGSNDATITKTEELTITGRSETTGPGNLTGVVRGVNADGTNGAANDWDSGTQISVGITSKVYNKIKDNLAAHQTILAVMPNRNAIINGDCRVNQRGTAFTLVKDAYTWDSDDLTGPDRHEGMATGTAVSAGTFGQSTSSLAGSSGYGFHFSGVTLTGTGIIYQRGRIEAKDAARFKNQTASFSCKVYQDTGGAVNFTVYIRKANSADNFAAVTAIGNSGAISIPNASDTSLNYEAISMGDCSCGIEYEIKGEVGAITTKNVYISEIQLEIGSVATAFENRPYGQELALCSRYVYILGNTGATMGNPPFGTYWYPTGKQAQFPLKLPVLMRAVPTLISSSPAWQSPPFSGNQFAIYNVQTGDYMTQSGTSTWSLTGATNNNYAMLQYQAGTTLSGNIGDPLVLYMSGTCGFVFSAEL